MNIREQIDELGFAIVDHALASSEIDAVLQDIEPLEASLRALGHGGIRDILRSSPRTRRLVTHASVCRVVEGVLGVEAFAVRGVLFDKHSEANWKVPWHQDLTITVRKADSIEGYGPWSVKAGVAHVQPPNHVLERMLTIRIHLDDCGPENGPVRVLAGSHRTGRLSTGSIADALTHHQEVTCAVQRGGLLVMRPLLLRASSAAVTVGRRRVLHIDFASCDLAPGLDWFERWQCAA